MDMKQIWEEYQAVVTEMLDKLVAVDCRHGTYAIVRISDMDITAMSERSPRFIRSARVESLSLLA